MGEVPFQHWTFPMANSISADVLSELRLLVVDGNRLRLPQQPLQHYAKIKQLLMAAFARYNRGGYFEFTKGIDAGEVLAKLSEGEAVSTRQSTQFFATPAGLARTVIEAACITPGMRVLEPSAGRGALATLARDAGGIVTAVEVWDVNAMELRRLGFNTIEDDFLRLGPADLGSFHAIVANPPFTRNSDVYHVTHMWRLLAPGGRISAVMSPAWQTSKDAVCIAFRRLVAAHATQVDDVPANTFSASGTNIRTVHVVLGKSHD